MKKIIFIVLMGFAISSCKDILELQPLDSLSEASVWKDQSLIGLMVNSSYNSVSHGFNGNLWGALCDEMVTTSDQGSYTVLKGTLTADNAGTVLYASPPFDYWKTGYTAIRSLNIYFSKIDAAPIDDAFKKRSNGEMKFIRAFVYANLIWRYGGVPIIKGLFDLGQDYSVKRNTYDECVNYICSELDEAIALLPAKQPASELGRASGDAAKALKSRVLLYAASPLNNPTHDMAKWQKAADAAEALLNSGYSLYADYQQLFLKDNSEIIFARYFTQNNYYASNSYFGRNGSGGGGNGTPTQNVVNDYEMTNGQPPYLDVAGVLTVNPASGFDPTNPYVNRDPRFEASILHDGSLWMNRVTDTFDGGLDSPGSSLQPWNASMTRYYLKKFLSPDIPPIGATVMPTSPWIFFRYGEVLLNYAEAKFELGDEPTARTYINKVRSRNGVAMPPVPITTTGEALRQKIYNERRIELVFEGHRFFDVRRWKIAMVTENKSVLGIKITKLGNGSKTYQINNVLSRSFSEKLYLLPIPRVEIDRSLGNLVQNPGY